MRKYIDITYTKEKDMKRSLDLYLPDEIDGSYPIFVYFHGGGLESNTKEVDPRIANTFAAANVGFVSVNYRKYPDAKYPDFIEDAADSVKWVFDNIKKYCKCTSVYIGGVSAGGYLSMMLCFDRKYLVQRGIDPLDINGYFHASGQPTKHFNVLKYECDMDRRRVIVDDTAPLYYVGLEEKYPKMHFTVSDNDIKGRYEQTMLMIGTLKAFGFDENTVTYALKSGTHCAYMGRFDDNGTNEFAGMVVDFIKKCEEA